MDDVEIKNIWMARCADKIVEFYGKNERPRANKAAMNYIETHGVEDDPVAIAVLIMEGWRDKCS